MNVRVSERVNNTRFIRQTKIKRTLTREGVKTHTKNRNITAAAAATALNDLRGKGEIALFMYCSTNLTLFACT